MKASELRNLGPDELREKLDALKKELMQYRFQTQTGKLEQQNLLQRTKRDIARVLTVMHEKKKEVA